MFGAQPSMTPAPVAPQSQPIGGQAPQGQNGDALMLAQALQQMRSQPQGNTMGLGANLAAAALLGYGAQRQQQQAQTQSPQYQQTSQMLQGIANGTDPRLQGLPGGGQ